MDILTVTPEFIPFSRVGGLADVTYHLARSLSERGHRVRIVTPKYRWTELAGYPLTPISDEIIIPLSRQEKSAKFYSARIESGIEVMFVACDEFFSRAGIYGNEYGDYEDNGDRFIFFSRAVLELIRHLSLAPDIIHCHEWQTGLVPAYAKTLYKDLETLSDTAILFTFHNLGTQGIFLHYDFSSTGLDWELFTPEYIESEGKLNLAKAGLIFADFISTVSQKYASEVLTSEFGFGLEEVLKKRRKDTFSILNGVDYQVWDPASDKYIAANFSPNNLRPKAQCREELARLFKLPLDDRPITAIISRLVDRKGLDIITAAMDRLATLDMKLVILGSGDDKYHIVLDGLAKAYPDRLGLKLTYERSLAHKVMAGADIFLMPSRYEPCGLEQLYGLKYGTVPVVRSTGGLEDTIIDFFQDPEAGTGFKFSDYSPNALFEVMRQVVALFKDQAAWKGLMLRGMDQDYSWAKATRKYEELYRRAIEKVGNSHVA